MINATTQHSQHFRTGVWATLGSRETIPKGGTSATHLELFRVKSVPHCSFCLFYFTLLKLWLRNVTNLFFIKGGVLKKVLVTPGVSEHRMPLQPFCPLLILPFVRPCICPKELFYASFSTMLWSASTVQCEV